MTELEALNLILAQGGNQEHVSSVESPTARGAAQELETAQKRILRRGFYFNTVTIDLTQETDGTVIIDEATYLWVMLPDTYTIIGGKVFDLENNTDIVSRNFTDVKAIKWLEIDEMPEVVAERIAWEAACKYAARYKGGRSAQADYCEEQHARAAASMSAKFPTPMNIPAGSQQSILAASAPPGFRWIELT